MVHLAGGNRDADRHFHRLGHHLRAAQVVAEPCAGRGRDTDTCNAVLADHRDDTLWADVDLLVEAAQCLGVDGGDHHATETPVGAGDTPRQKHQPPVHHPSQHRRADIKSIWAWRDVNLEMTAVGDVRRARQNRRRARRGAVDHIGHVPVRPDQTERQDHRVRARQHGGQVLHLAGQAVADIQFAHRDHRLIDRLDGAGQAFLEGEAQIGQVLFAGFEGLAFIGGGAVEDRGPDGDQHHQPRGGGERGRRRSRALDAGYHTTRRARIADPGSSVRRWRKAKGGITCPRER